MTWPFTRFSERNRISILKIIGAGLISTNDKRLWAMKGDGERATAVFPKVQERLSEDCQMHDLHATVPR